MPTYVYECDGCGHSFEQYQSFAEDPVSRCPACRDHPVRRVQFAPQCFVKSVTTFGQQAEVNQRKLGHYGMADIAGAEAEKKAARKRAAAERIAEVTGGSVPDPIKPATPWWRSGEVPGTSKMEKPLDLSQVRDVQAFVETGKTT